MATRAECSVPGLAAIRRGAAKESSPPRRSSGFIGARDPRTRRPPPRGFSALTGRPELTTRYIFHRSQRHVLQKLDELLLKHSVALTGRWGDDQKGVNVVDALPWVAGTGLAGARDPRLLHVAAPRRILFLLNRDQIVC